MRCVRATRNPKRRTPELKARWEGTKFRVFKVWCDMGEPEGAEGRCQVLQTVEHLRDKSERHSSCN
eukprot:3164398-Prorocentrum_lima.AAC.1